MKGVKGEEGEEKSAEGPAEGTDRLDLTMSLIFSTCFCNFICYLPVIKF